MERGDRDGLRNRCVLIFLSIFYNKPNRTGRNYRIYAEFGRDMAKVVDFYSFLYICDVRQVEI